MLPTYIFARLIFLNSYSVFNQTLTVKGGVHERQYHSRYTIPPTARVNHAAYVMPVSDHGLDAIGGRG